MDNSLNPGRYHSQNKDRQSQGQADPPRHSSPLRLKKKESKKQYREEEDEEEEYELRREEELKRQIRSKESEIQNLSKASDFLRQKLDQSITLTQRQQQQQDNRYASFGRKIPERDKSPYQQRSAAGIKQDSLNDLNPPPPHIREHLSNLQSDNASLMRRLNLVLQELDRVSKEKEEIQNRLQQSAKESMNLQRLINGEDNMDKVNRYMQEDLAYEQERNQKMKEQIKEQDQYKNELIAELKSVENSQDSQARQSQNISSDLQKKLSNIQDLEREIYYSQEKVKQLNHAIEQGKKEEMSDVAEKQDLQRIVNQLLYERNDLLLKLDNLTSRYDECVREISQDRADMERHNRQHSKLVTAKIIFQELEFLLKNKYKVGLEEIKVYCLFDSKCHQKLQQFAKVLNIVGKFQKNIALKKWFQAGLKPLEIKKQSNAVAIQIYRTGLLGRKFHHWRKRYERRIDQYDMKTKAIQRIWTIKIQDAKIEQKRSLVIWKEVMQKARTQKSKLKKLIYGAYFKKISLAMNAWANHNNNLESQIRLNLLSKQFSQKQYLNLLFNSFRYQSFELKRKRNNILFHYLKYWQDYINQRKFLMGAQVQAMHFQRSIACNVVKSCFDALKQNKEEEKFNKTNYELNEIERPLIGDLSNDLQATSEQRLNKLKKLAGDCLCRMAGKNINQYFGKWKKIYQDFKDAPTTKLRGRLIKAYNDKIRLTFNKWKVLLQQRKVENNQFVVMEQQELQKDLTDEVVNLQKELKDKQEQKDQSGNRHINKCLQSYQKRMMRLGLGRWKDKMAEINIKEGGAETVVKRLRTRMLRQAFDLYVKGLKYKKKLEIEEERCRYYNKTRNERLLNHVFNQWRIYKNNFKTSKAYWYRIYQKIDRQIQKKGFKKWIEVTFLRQEKEVMMIETNSIDNVTELNHQIGELHQIEEAQQQQLKQMKQSLTRQAQRVLANTFAKYYYVGQTRGFERWREFVNFEKQKETLIKRMIEHWKKHKYYFMKSCFQNWMLNADIKERKDQIKKEEGKIKDTDFAFDIQSKMFADAKNKLDNELQEINTLQKLYNQRLSKSIQMIVHKTNANYYMSQKRYILLQWRTYVKREKNFINCMKNAMQKCLWKEGFKAIKEHSREDFKRENLETVLNKFRVKFWKRTCENAFSAWRRGIFNTVFETIQDTVQETNDKIQEHEEKVTKRKEVNSNKSGKVIKTQNLRNLFYGWRNTARFMKMQATKKALYINTVQHFQKKCAITKWRSRKVATFQARLRIQRLKEKFKKLRKMLVFRELKTKYYNSKDFMNRMSNLANIHDHQALKMGYNCIISFSRAKKYVHMKKKEHASMDVFSILNNLIQRRKARYLADLKYRTLDQYKQQITKGFTVFHHMINKMRVYFNRWKESAEKTQLAQEMHEEGPVREQIFEDRINLTNCQNFMKDEGYDEDDIREALKQGKLRQSQLMLKTVRRFQHYNPQLYTKPKMFDRWKQFVHLRRLFKYWLRFVNNRGQYVKCDIAVSFDRWKRYDKLQKEALMKLSKNQLDNRVLKNAAVLGELADEIQDKENTLKHLNDQRDELVENYIKGQKLALALWLNNLQRSKHRAFLRWSKNAQALTSAESDDALRKNVELIAALKDRIHQLEKENDDYSNENEELRQFSLDGYEIAKNVQALSQEREKLSVDLADKAQVIRKLLDENEKLNKNVKQAQDEASNLIKQSNKHMGGSSSSSGGVPFQSPMMRNNVY